jgi:hypothetical protein
VSQCRATARRTGARCQRRAIKGATVCLSHGGAAPQVRDKARQRVALTRAAELLGPVVQADPAQVLISAVRSSAALLGAAEAAVRAEEPDADALHALGEAAMLAGRLAKLALDSGIEQRLARQAEEAGELVGSLITRTITALALPPETAAAAYRHVRSEVEVLGVAAGPLGRLNVAELDQEIARVVQALDDHARADALCGFPAKLARAIDAGFAVLDLDDDQRERVTVAVESFLQDEAEQSAQLAQEISARPPDPPRAWWVDSPRYDPARKNGARR